MEYCKVRYDIYNPITVNTAPRLPKTIAIIVSVDRPELLLDELGEFELFGEFESLDEDVPVFPSGVGPEFAVDVLIAALAPAVVAMAVASAAAAVTV